MQRNLKAVFYSVQAQRPALCLPLRPVIGDEKWKVWKDPGKGNAAWFEDHV